MTLSNRSMMREFPQLCARLLFFVILLWTIILIKTIRQLHFDRVDTLGKSHWYSMPTTRLRLYREGGLSRSVTWQLQLLRRVGFRQVELLHKNSCFLAAFGAIKCCKPPRRHSFSETANVSSAGHHESVLLHEIPLFLVFHYMGYGGDEGVLKAEALQEIEAHLQP